MHRTFRLGGRHAAFLISAAATLWLGRLVHADIKLPAIISDNMLLQADQPDNIWGISSPGEKVTVSFDGQTVSATADGNGAWKATLAKMKSGDAGDMTIAGANSITIKNVLVGSVWICSGQSNMEFGMKNVHNSATEVPKADDPQLRLFLVAKDSELKPQTDLGGSWQLCTPKTILEGGWGGFSAVGYFFGKELRQTTGEPVGLIDSTWGGTPVEAWTSIEALTGNPSAAEYTKKYHDIADNIPAQEEKYKAAQAAYPSRAQFAKMDADAKAAGQKPKTHPLPPADPTHNPWTPSSLFNGMINPLLNYGIQGAIWYQGESNAGDIRHSIQYQRLFPLMIGDWRTRWGEGNFPFIFVQLASYTKSYDMPVDQPWSYLRDSQLWTLENVPNTGMAVTIDIGAGPNIHPPDKMDVGHRLALWAENLVWNKGVVDSGPIYDSMKVEGNSIRVKFNSLGHGLAIGIDSSQRLDAPTTQPADHLIGFEIAGADKKFVFADTTIDGDSIVVHSDQVADPVAVRYAWATLPKDCNLYNKEGLPASPFRSDDWRPATPPVPVWHTKPKPKSDRPAAPTTAPTAAAPTP